MKKFYLMGPYENNERPSICRDDPNGGDPLTIVTLARIHRVDELREILERANCYRAPSSVCSNPRNTQESDSEV